MKCKKLLTIVLVIFISSFSFDVYPWSGRSHSGITNQAAINNDYLSNYLKAVGFSKGAETFFNLSDNYPGGSQLISRLRKPFSKS